MHVISEYANVCFWPKADIETESKLPLANVCFGEKSGRSRCPLFTYLELRFTVQFDVLVMGGGAMTTKTAFCVVPLRSLR